MYKWILVLLVSLPAFAVDMDRAPKAFGYQNAKAIYVDFLSADYHLTYDITARQATVMAKIRFMAPEAGYPIFDLKTDPTIAWLDGKSVPVKAVKTPDNATTVLILESIANAGEHEMTISAPLASLVSWDNGGVHSATWTTDLSDRGYLEQYMPANMEFDRVPMTFHVKFVGMTKKQMIYANGVVSEKSSNEFMVKFPEYFTSSSLFFHTVPEGVMSETRFSFRSIDGRELPVVIYLRPGMFGGGESQLALLKEDTIQVLTELEGDYGPFLHPSVTIYNAGSGGMEYMGATMTSRSALGHELTHSYFARGIVPANGNAGWIDEALASWRDEGYQRANGFSGGANMAGRAGYTRFTDSRAYSYGERFMRSLDGLLADKGGLKSLLREIVEKKAFQPFYTEDFIEWAEGHYRVSLKDIFQQRVFKNGLTDEKSKPVESVHHQKLTLEQLKELL